MGDAHVEAAYDFVKELSGSMHAPDLRDEGLRADRDDVRIDKTWRILTPQDAGQIVQTAIEDFRDFMRVSMHEELEVETYDPLIGPENDARAIVVRCGHSENPVERQSFTVRSASDWMAVEGGDEPGVLYGFLHLEELFTERRAPLSKPMRVSRRPLCARRILRAYHSPYYENELDQDQVYYSDAYLARLAHDGYNGIWLHQRLCELTSLDAFERYHQGAAERVKKLNDLVARAERYGIGVYLYLNEPRGLPANDDLYGEHPEMKGHVDERNIMEGEGAYAAMCTSSKEVRRALAKESGDLFRNVPGLAGVILITMSEHLTHCWSHTNKTADQTTTCPRCAEREPAEVISEVVNLIAEGVHGAKPDAEVIAWTWSWDMAEKVPHEQILTALNDDVIVMADFERGQWIKQRKRRWFADEYMLSLPGPTDDFRKKRRMAESLGKTVWAKVQIANTHELATVPYIPVPAKLAEKFTNMRAEGVKGYMGCWIFGNYPSIMTELAGRYSWEPLPESPQQYLRVLAAKIYGDEGAPDAVAAWRRMSRAFGSYPFSQHLVYVGPMNYTCIYPFRLHSAGIEAGPSWILHENFGDGLDWASLGLDTPDEKDFIREQFEIVVSGWREGLTRLAEAADKAPDALKARAERDYGVAEATMLHLDSTICIMAFLQARDRLEGGDDRAAAIADMKAAMEAELANRKRLLEICRRDSRIGFHSEAGYWYRPEQIEAAIAALEKQLAEEIDQL